MSETQEIGLPSGMVLEVEPWLAPELTRLGRDARSAKPSDGLVPFYNALTWAWRRVVDPGPYAFPVGDVRPEKPWRKMLAGDILSALKQLRRMSAGETYWVPFDCPKCGDKDKIAKVPVDELVDKPLSADGRRRVAGGEPFSARVAGREITFNLQLGRHEEDALQLLKELKDQKKPHARQPRVVRHVAGLNLPSLIEGAAVRLVKIDGAEKSAFERWEWVAGLRLEQVDDLRDAFDEPDCGVLTDHEIKCGSCQEVATVTVPLLTGRYFWTRPTPEVISQRSWQGSSGVASSGPSAEPATSGGESATA